MAGRVKNPGGAQSKRDAPSSTVGKVPDAMRISSSSGNSEVSTATTRVTRNTCKRHSFTDEPIPCSTAQAALCGAAYSGGGSVQVPEVVPIQAVRSRMNDWGVDRRVIQKATIAVGSAWYPRIRMPQDPKTDL